MPDEVIQVANVSKFLMAVEKGEIVKYEGKRLNDIPLQEDLLEGKLFAYSCQMYLVGMI